MSTADLGRLPSGESLPSIHRFLRSWCHFCGTMQMQASGRVSLYPCFQSGLLMPCKMGPTLINELMRQAGVSISDISKFLTDARVTA